MDKRFLEKILKADDDKIIRIILDNLKYRHIKTDFKNFIFAIPDNPIPICLVAHWDTIRQCSLPFINKINGIWTCPMLPLGADDRAGVYALLKLQKYQPYLLFFGGEERGGVGARLFCEFYDKLEGVNLLVELDREGFSEYVVYDLFPEKVEQYIESFDYVMQTGLFSDIAILSEHFNIPAVNLSIGYYNQHTCREILSLSLLDYCIKQIEQLLANPLDTLYPLDKCEVFGKGDLICW